VKQEILRTFNLLFYTDMLEGTHLIREFYSVHPETKCFKVLVDPDNPRPKKVKLGEELEVDDISYKDCLWEPPGDLLDRCFERLKDREVEERSKPKKRSRRTTKISYIENLLDHPEKVTDGRRRILAFAIIPYLIQQQYSEQEVLDTCRDWVERTGKRWSDYKSLVKYQVNFCLNRDWNPMSLSKLRKKLQ